MALDFIDQYLEGLLEFETRTYQNCLPSSFKVEKMYEDYTKKIDEAMSELNNYL